MSTTPKSKSGKMPGFVRTAVLFRPIKTPAANYATDEIRSSRVQILAYSAKATRFKKRSRIEKRVALEAPKGKGKKTPVPPAHVRRRFCLCAGAAGARSGSPRARNSETGNGGAGAHADETTASWRARGQPRQPPAARQPSVGLPPACRVAVKTKHFLLLARAAAFVPRRVRPHTPSCTTFRFIKKGIFFS